MKTGFALLAVGLVGGCVAANAEETKSQVAGKQTHLPSMPPPFLGVTWTNSNAELLKRFPGARSDSASYTGQNGQRMSATTIFDIKTKIFGRTAIEIVRAPGLPASFIQIGTEDSRPECSVEDREPAVHCDNVYSDRLVKRFKKLEATLRENLGKPVGVTSVHDKEPGPAPDKRERELKWVRQGAEFYLSMTIEEGAGWRVTVSAKRTGAPL